MQMIEAVIKPQKLDVVKLALAKLGILGVTAIEVKGYGKQAGHTERYRGGKMDVGFVPKILLQICVKSEETTAACEAIATAARTGEVGDGKIFVYPINDVVRIRTGDRNEKRCNASQSAAPIRSRMSWVRRGWVKSNCYRVHGK